MPIAHASRPASTPPAHPTTAPLAHRIFHTLPHFLVSTSATGSNTHVYTKLTNIPLSLYNDLPMLTKYPITHSTQPPPNLFTHHIFNSTIQHEFTTPCSPQIHVFCSPTLCTSSPNASSAHDTPYINSPAISSTHRSPMCTLELCADVIVSAAARRRSKKVGGGGAARRGRPKTFFSKIHEKISFFPQNFLRNFFSHQSFEVCR